MFNFAQMRHAGTVIGLHCPELVLLSGPAALRGRPEK